MKKTLIVLAVLGCTVLAAQAQMAQPKMATVSGTLIDLTCASKAKAMMNSWANTKSDHMMPDGKVQKGCAEMCLQGGQPAALFDGEAIQAVFACNPKATLAKFAAENVDVQGFWAGDGTVVKTFIPTKIRAKGGSWSDVNCETMHN